MRKCSYTKTDPKSHWHDTGEGGNLPDFPWGEGVALQNSPVDRPREFHYLFLFSPKEPKVGAFKRLKDESEFSKVALIVVIAVSSFVILFLLFIIVVLYRRKKRYGGFYIFTLPPAPDYIMKLDSERSLLEQTSKLPYDAQWEFPRERLEICKYRLCIPVSFTRSTNFYWS